MTEPDEDLAELTEQEEERLRPEVRDVEAPEPDMVEQATPASPGRTPEQVRPGLEVNDWDAVEQAQVVELDDGYDYR
ncbi:MAG TPA: hypothetical protein VF054_20225 [Micromonosporaceae bacterium]